MAVDRNAVREGTRWWFDGEEVVVEEVTPKSVVYSRESFSLGLISVDDFLLRASDLTSARHESLVKRFGRRLGRDPSDEVADALTYLLGRVGTPVPAFVPPSESAPNAEAASAYICGCGTCATDALHTSDCAVHSEPAYPAGPCDCAPVEVTVEPEPVEGYAIAMPADEPPSVRKRRGSW